MNHFDVEHSSRPDLMQTDQQLPLILLASVASFSMIVFAVLWLATYFPFKPELRFFLSFLSLLLSWPTFFVLMTLFRKYWGGIFITLASFLIFIVPLLHFYSMPIFFRLFN